LKYTAGMITIKMNILFPYIFAFFRITAKNKQEEFSKKQALPFRSQPRMKIGIG